jgi:hypothetical protein
LRIAQARGEKRDVLAMTHDAPQSFFDACGLFAIALMTPTIFLL